MENYNVDYFIEKFKAIPEGKWTVNSLKNSFGQSCAYGHCKHANTDEGRALTNVFKTLNSTTDSLIANINDGRNPKYQQPTPKQRVLAALMDIKNKEEGDRAIEIVNNIIKEEKLELV